MPENIEAVNIWCLLDAHARDYAGMDGWPMKIRLEATRAECDRSIDPAGNFNKVILLESLIYTIRYKRKTTSK